MILNSDDFPVPLGPTTPILAPWRNERVTLSRTTLSPWALRTLRSVKTYSAMRASLRGSAPTSTIAPVGPDGTAHAARAGCSATPASSTAGAVIGVLSDALGDAVAAPGRVRTVVPCERSWPTAVATTSKDVCG